MGPTSLGMAIGIWIIGGLVSAAAAGGGDGPVWVSPSRSHVRADDHAVRPVAEQLSLGESLNGESRPVLRWRTARLPMEGRADQSSSSPVQQVRPSILPVSFTAPEPVAQNMTQSPVGSSASPVAPSDGDPLAPLPPMELSPPPEPLLSPALPSAQTARLPSSPVARPQADQPLSRLQRDCAKELDKCEQIRDKLRADLITRISLDITPSLKPEAKTPDEAQRALDERIRELRRDPQNVVREWNDRDGAVVAKGLLTGISYGRAVIQLEDGQSVRIPLRQLVDDDLCFVASWWDVPTECRFGDTTQPGRDFEPITFTWKASALCHKPLYFEEVQLERYGHTAGPIMQPLASGAHFCLNIAALPYRAGINPPNECLYSLGYYRPGSCAPWLVPPVPLSLRGAALQTGAVAAGIVIIP